MWIIAIVAAAAVMVDCAAWIRTNPFPSYYDEALYAIYALIDVWATKTYGIVGAGFAMWTVDPSVPPALRLLALPFTLATSPSLMLLRALSLIGFIGAAAIAAMAVKRVAGSAAAATAFACTFALPILIVSTRMYGTEYPLLLAIALLLLGLTATRHNIWLLALSVALGLLAKTSYAVVAAPALIAAAIVMKERRRAIAIGVPIGLIISLAWWAHDPMRAIRFGVTSGGFSRHSLGGSFLRYAYELLRCDFGFGVAAAVLLCLIAGGIRKLPPFSIVCLSGALPLLILHATSANNNPRLVALPTFLIVLAATALLPRMKTWQQLAVFALALVQIAVMILPLPRRDDGSYIWRGVSEVMAPVEQWNWSPLHRFADSRGLQRPRIATLGEGYAFNPPQIRYAWPELRGEIPAEQLYEWTSGKPFDLQRLLDRAAMAQLVVTAPGYRGEATDGQVPNNRYNTIFADALVRDQRFEGPYIIDVGLRRNTPVQVFVRR